MAQWPMSGLGPRICVAICALMFSSRLQVEPVAFLDRGNAAEGRVVRPENALGDEGRRRLAGCVNVDFFHRLRIVRPSDEGREAPELDAVGRQPGCVDGVAAPTARGLDQATARFAPTPEAVATQRQEVDEQVDGAEEPL